LGSIRTRWASLCRASGAPDFLWVIGTQPLRAGLTCDAPTALGIFKVARVYTFQSKNLLGGGKRGVAVLGQIDVLPIAVDDAGADLGGGFAFAKLFEGVERFALANVAAGTVAADEAIEQAGVALALIAVAVAGLLIESFANASGGGVGVGGFSVGELRGIHGFGERAGGRGGMERGDVGGGVVGVVHAWHPVL
jgi:hypothetical protein